MNLAVYWTRFAQDKLDDIYNFYSLKASPVIAEKLINGIIDVTINLEQNPEIGQQEPLLLGRNQEFRYLIYKSYKIIYYHNLQLKRIDIINVFDTRQNPIKIKRRQ